MIRSCASISSALLFAALLTSSRGVAQPHRASDGYLAWVIESGGDPASARSMTVWIDGAPDATPPRLAVDGPVWVVGGRLLSWSTETRHFTAMECDSTGASTARTVRRSAPVGLLRDLETGEESVLFDGRRFADSTGQDYYEAGIVPLGSVGSDVAVVYSAEGMGCGAAHPWQATEVVWSSLDTGTVLPLASLLTEEEVESESSWGRPLAVARAVGLGVDPDDAPDLTLATLLPSYTPAGDLRVDYVFVGSTCYACNRGDQEVASAYEFGARIRGRRIPERFRSHSDTPDAITRYIGRTGSTLLGWTQLPNRPDARQRLRRAFSRHATR